MLPLALERPDARVRPRQLLWWALGAIALVTVVVPVMRALDDVPRADVTFGNVTPWDVNVDLIADDGRHLPLATIGAGTNLRIEEIGVPRGEWVFELSSWGHSQRVTMSDRQLRAVRNRVDLPPELVRELEEANPPHSPFFSS